MLVSIEQIAGSAYAGYLTGMAGDDIIDGGDGGDRIFYNPADNPGSVTGSAGMDTLVFLNMSSSVNNLQDRGFEFKEKTTTDLDNSKPIRSSHT